MHDEYEYECCDWRDSAPVEFLTESEGWDEEEDEEDEEEDEEEEREDSLIGLPAWKGMVE